MSDLDWGVNPNDETVQNSKAWLEWRAKGIGSSDAPIIMGKSPWSTPYKLWLEKTGQVQNTFTGNWATERGHRVEPIVRDKFNKELGMAMQPQTFVHPKIDFLRCSCDGWFEKYNVALEVKVPGAKDHETAQKGLVPNKYQWQLVHQFLVTGATKIFYCSYFLDKDQDDHEGELVTVVVEPDKILQEQYIECATRFWQNVKDKTPPPLTDQDRLNVADDSLKALVEKYKDLKAEADVAKQRLEIVTDELKEFAKGHGHPKLECGGVRITRVDKKGTINYKKVPALDGVDLEEYRGKGTSYYKIEEVKK